MLPLSLSQTVRASFFYFSLYTFPPNSIGLLLLPISPRRTRGSGFRKNGMILITGEVLQENIIIIKIDVYISEDEEKKEWHLIR